MTMVQCFFAAFVTLALSLVGVDAKPLERESRSSDRQQEQACDERGASRTV